MVTDPPVLGWTAVGFDGPPQAEIASVSNASKAIHNWRSRVNAVTSSGPNG
jgi:hypothetical protein